MKRVVFVTLLSLIILISMSCTRQNKQNAQIEIDNRFQLIEIEWMPKEIGTYDTPKYKIIKDTNTGIKYLYVSELGFGAEGGTSITRLWEK